MQQFFMWGPQRPNLGFGSWISDMGFCLQVLFVQILDFGFRILGFVPRFGAGAYIR